MIGSNSSRYERAKRSTVARSRVSSTTSYVPDSFRRTRTWSGDMAARPVDRNASASARPKSARNESTGRSMNAARMYRQKSGADSDRDDHDDGHQPQVPWP